MMKVTDKRSVESLAQFKRLIASCIAASLIANVSLIIDFKKGRIDK